MDKYTRVAIWKNSQKHQQCIRYFFAVVAFMDGSAPHFRGGADVGHLYLQPMIYASDQYWSADERIVFSSCIWLINALIVQPTCFKWKRFLSDLFGEKKFQLYNRTYWEVCRHFVYQREYPTLQKNTGKDSLIIRLRKMNVPQLFTWKATLNEPLQHFQAFQRILWL